LALVKEINSRESERESVAMCRMKSSMATKTMSTKRGRRAMVSMEASWWRWAEAGSREMEVGQEG
jgi:hypothetical protein